MNNKNENAQFSGLLHEIKAPIDAILSYSRLIAESEDPVMKNYAQKITAAAAKVTEVIDGSLDMAAECDDTHARKQRTLFPAPVSDPESTPLVLVVDDDELICESVAAMLGKIYRTETAQSGDEAIEKLASIRPSLIMLDMNMPDMDGFDTLARIRHYREFSSIPVIFLTGDEGRDAEIRCLRAGASDFVRKPLASQVIVERVRRIIELDRLQHFLSSEVAVQTKRSANLSIQVMLALAQAVDAKDHYTNGHSQRVAAYSAEIARRMGKTQQEQDDIYAMGLLHDVGKIGVSEAIINKTSRLDDDEYAQIKKHTEIGHRILKVITEIPGLATGARWHHERYDGRGYPDGLCGENIPEEARIICIADCYDAMTSNRSYSNVREQAAVRAEMIRCKGSQFDPVITDIMIAMIDDDPEYKMSERAGHNAVIPSEVSDTETVRSVSEVPEKPRAVTPGAPFIPDIAELDMAAARRNIADEEILALTVKRFYELMPIKLQKLKEAYETAVSGGEISAYRIGAHSVKSGSATIGLIAFSEMARALEKLANDNDLAGIRELHEPFVSEWERIYTKLDAAYKHQAPKAVASERPDGTAMLPELLEALRSYMKNTDIEAADDTIKLTEAYSYSESIQNMLNELKTAVLSFDENAASELINKMTEELAK